MNQIPIATLISAAALLSGCGGSSDSPSPGATYAFVTPHVGDQRTYSATIEDSNSNTLTLDLISQITVVNTDGSYSDTYSGSDVVTIDGETFGATERRSFNGDGQELSYTYSTPNGGTGSCAFDPYGGGAPIPLYVDQAWQLQYTSSCNGNAPITYTQSGSVVDLESVTVPAGTFNALKLQSTITWTNSHNTTYQESITNWRDVMTLKTVKESITYTVSGTLPSEGYVTAETIELQSASA